MMYLWAVLIAMAVSGALFLAAVRYPSARIAELPQAIASMRPIDAAALHTLTDPVEDDFLRTLLDAATLRQVRRERIAATLAYMTSMFHNAGVLIRIAGFASGDAAEAAAKLADRAIQTRILSALAIAHLAAAYLWPSLIRPKENAFAAYANLREVFAHYVYRTYPTMASRLTSAL